MIVHTYKSPFGWTLADSDVLAHMNREPRGRHYSYVIRNWLGKDRPGLKTRHIHAALRRLKALKLVRETFVGGGGMMSEWVLA